VKLIGKLIAPPNSSRLSRNKIHVFSFVSNDDITLYHYGEYCIPFEKTENVIRFSTQIF